MSRTLSRVAGGTLGLIIAAAATNVAVARAQTQPTTGGGVPAVSTDCGSGTIIYCSTVDTFKCEWTVSISYNPITRGVVFDFDENCIKSGTKPIYKDRYPQFIQTGGCVGRVEDVPDGDAESCI